MSTNQNWLVDGSEHFVANMGYSTSYGEPQIYNVFDNLKFEGETPEVLSYSVNGLHRYAALDKDSGTTNTSNIKMYKDGSFTIEPDKTGIYYNRVDSFTMFPIWTCGNMGRRKWNMLSGKAAIPLPPL